MTKSKKEVDFNKTEIHIGGKVDGNLVTGDNNEIRVNKEEIHEKEETVVSKIFKILPSFFGFIKVFK